MLQRVSSNTTLFFRIFIPVFFAVFFGAFTLMTWIADTSTLGYLSHPAFRLSNTVFYLAVLLILYLTVWKLKRVEFDTDHFYVTNYIKTYKYRYEDIDAIFTHNYLILRTGVIVFRERSAFGRRITFIQSGLFRRYVEEHPGKFEGKLY